MSMVHDGEILEVPQTAILMHSAGHPGKRNLGPQKTRRKKTQNNAKNTKKTQKPQLPYIFAEGPPNRWG